MATLQQRQDPARLIWRRLWAVLILLAVVVAARGAWGVYQKEHASRVLKVEAEAELTELEKREMELRAEIAALKSEHGIEAELRERYDLAAEGEGVVIITGSEPPSSPAAPSRYQRLKNWFSW